VYRVISVPSVPSTTRTSSDNRSVAQILTTFHCQIPDSNFRNPPLETTSVLREKIQIIVTSRKIKLTCILLFDDIRLILKAICYDMLFAGLDQLLPCFAFSSRRKWWRCEAGPRRHALPLRDVRQRSRHRQQNQLDGRRYT